MEKNLMNQHIYIIGNQDIGEQEIFFYREDPFDHMHYYKRILEVYPELIERYNLLIQRDLPEQYAQHGMVVFESAGEIKENIRYAYENLEYSGLLYLPKRLSNKQIELLSTRMHEFEKIYLELAICDINNVEYITKENDEYVAYQKLKSMIRK